MCKLISVHSILTISRLRVGQRIRESSASSLEGSTSFHDYHQQGIRQRSAEELESQNDEAIEGLAARVKLLKDVCDFTHLAEHE